MINIKIIYSLLTKIHIKSSNKTPNIQHCTQQKSVYSNEDLTKHDFSNKILIGVRFVNCQLRECFFTGADLSFAQFINCDLYRSNLEKVILYVTKFDSCNLTRTIFDMSCIYGVTFYNVNITYSSFTNLQLESKRRININKQDISNLDEKTYKEVPVGGNIDAYLNFDVISKFKCNNFYFDIRNWKNKHEKYSEYAQIYNRLKRVYKENNFLLEAAEFYYLERKALRKSWYKQDPKDARSLSKYCRIKKTIFSFLSEIVCGYGEKPLRVITWIGATWGIFGYYYYIYGSFKDPLTSSENIWIKIYNSLYYSLCTMVTLSNNSIPVGFTKAFALLESVLGVLLFAIFTASIIRQIIRD